MASGIVKFENGSSVRGEELVAHSKIGIGTHTQTANVHCVADAPVVVVEDKVGNSTQSALRILADGGTTHLQSGVDLSSDSKGDFKFQSMLGGTTHMTIDGTNSRVGIGSATPIGKLQVDIPNASAETAAWDATKVVFGDIANGNSQGLGFGVSTNSHASIISLAPGVAWRGLSYYSQWHKWYINGVEKMALDATNLTLSGTGAVTVPTGTSAERPSTAATGMLRYNTTLDTPEVRTSTGWGELAVGAGGLWIESNSNIYYDANVAIGTSSVTSGARLEVAGNIVATNLTLSSTGAMTIPIGTTAQRPSTAATGMLRYNTTLNTPEIYGSSGWGDIATGVPLYSFTTHTFTPAGATGCFGPTLTQCRNTYNVTWDTDTSLFNMTTQGIQEWTVPANGSYTIVCRGASGGAFGNPSGSSPGFPGEGATITATFSLAKNTILKIVVGQKPTSTSSSGFSGSAGGGASWVYTGSIGSSTGLLIVAGGGGGTGHGSGSTYAGNGRGGNSGTSSLEGGYNSVIGTGSNARTGTGSAGSKGVGEGGRGTNWFTNNNGSGGGAGWKSDGNDDESPQSIANGYGGYGGDRFTGGRGEGNTTGPSAGGFGGGGGSGGNGNSGGGGGGYSGGGAGQGWTGSHWGGGGGGGSYIDSSGTSTTLTAGTDAINQSAVHDGYVTITKI